MTAVGVISNELDLCSSPLVKNVETDTRGDFNSTPTWVYTLTKSGSQMLTRQNEPTWSVRQMWAPSFGW